MGAAHQFVKQVMDPVPPCRLTSEAALEETWMHWFIFATIVRSLRKNYLLSSYVEGQTGTESNARNRCPAFLDKEADDVENELEFNTSEERFTLLEREDIQDCLLWMTC